MHPKLIKVFPTLLPILPLVGNLTYIGTKTLNFFLILTAYSIYIHLVYSWHNNLLDKCGRNAPFLQFEDRILAMGLRLVLNLNKTYISHQYHIHTTTRDAGYLKIFILTCLK